MMGVLLFAALLVSMVKSQTCTYDTLNNQIDIATVVNLLTA